MLDKYINKKYFLYTAISLTISYFIITLSGSKDSWYSFWRLLNVPTMWPAFADIDHIYRSLLCKLNGLDPTEYNPCDINGVTYQYPIIWLPIFEFLKLNIFSNFKVFVFCTLTFYIFCNFILIDLAKKKFNKLILIFLFFSASSLLLIERGNVDHIIFVLTIATLASRNYYYEMFLIFINSCLKIFPIFTFFYLIKNNKKILLTFLIMLLTIFLLYEISISKYIKPNHSFMAITQAYGVLSITEGIFKILEQKYLLFLDLNIKNLIRLVSIFIFIIICFSIFVIGTKSKGNNISSSRNQEKLFLIGASIYVGSYIFFSNIDYRLIFLFLTIPYVENLKPKLNYIYSISILIISNSWHIRLAPLSINHIIFTSIIYLIKLIILIFLCYWIGRISKSFFQNLKEIKILK
jgi:hypothetical protein